jgi:hypothetical protein
VTNRPVPGVQMPTQDSILSCPVAAPPVALGRVPTGGVVPEGGSVSGGASGGESDCPPTTRTGEIPSDWPPPDCWRKPWV